MSRTLDAPGATCYFESHRCSHLAEGHGGFDQHHPRPIELGGSEDEMRIPLCPLHHRRAHALLRYLVEMHASGVEPSWLVLKHFTAAERNVAEAAVAGWAADGLPVPQWNVPAAR